MCNGGVDADDQVQRLDNFGGIGKLKEAGGRMLNCRIRFKEGLVDGRDDILQKQQ